MLLERIPTDSACRLLEGQAGGILPINLYHASWYADEGHGYLGAVVTLNGQVGFALFARDEHDQYFRFASGTGYQSELAAALDMQTCRLSEDRTA